MLAKKSLGQNFLINKSKIKKIVDSLDLEKGDIVIEIGPGHGELTEELVIRNQELEKIIAIEKDRVLARNLKEKFKNNKNIEIIDGDALKLLHLLIKDLKSYKIVGNIPYYITGYLFRIIGDLDNKPSVAVFTIQKEVAQRICAKKGEMNLLSASVQFWAEPKITDILLKGNFRPIPKVDSAVISLQTTADRLQQNNSKNSKLLAVDSKQYYNFIKILFKQPRKTILNNLRYMTNNLQLLKEKLELLKIDINTRPQDLTLSQIILLSKTFKVSP